ncbi:MAG: prolipoprotein diacylglyceryl transferase family protein [bacterium]
MLPILIQLGPIKIFSFGVCLALGIFIALYFWWKMGREEHFDEISLFDSYFLSLIIFVISGRLGYVLLHWADLGTLYRSLAILAFPGMNVVSGVLASSIFIILFARERGWEIEKTLDSWVVTLSTILVFGSLGGLLNGSGVSRMLDVWGLGWAIVTFVTVSRVRKNFRFYAWYKGEASSAKEGLAGLIFVLLSGIYYLGMGVVNPSNWGVGGLLIVGSGYTIYRRIGRKNTFVNLLQWLRQIRRK